MIIARYPCQECGQPFDSREEQKRHWQDFGHGPNQVQADAVDRARWGVMGDEAPDPVFVTEEPIGQVLLDMVDAKLGRGKLSPAPGVGDEIDEIHVWEPGWEGKLSIILGGKK